MASGPVYFDIAYNRSRLFVPLQQRRVVFNILHRQAHGGGTATAALIAQLFVWPGMNREIRRWVKMCEQCQKAKVHRHTSTPLVTFTARDRRFGHIHLDLVGPLPVSDGAKYLLTCVDRFTRWPVDNMSAHTVASTLVTNWIARFGVPDVITTDQGRQFESNLMHDLNSTFGIQHVRTFPLPFQVPTF